MFHSSPSVAPLHFDFEGSKVKVNDAKMHKLFSAVTALQIVQFASQ